MFLVVTVNTLFGQRPQRLWVALGCSGLFGVGSGLALSLISRFSVIDYEVQDGTRKLVTKITCARALVRRISANGKFIQTGSGTEIKLWRVR